MGTAHQCFAFDNSKHLVKAVLKCLRSTSEIAWWAMPTLQNTCLRWHFLRT